MEKLTQKWAIISLLEDVPEGTEFYYTDFPLHVTLAGVFGIDKNGAWLIDELTKILSIDKSFEIETDTSDMFGPNKDVAVMKVRKSAELINLYRQIHDWLEESGAKYNSPEYQGEGYLPHITVQKSGSFEPGEKLVLNSISLIDLFPNNDGYQRKIFKTVNLL